MVSYTIGNDGQPIAIPRRVGGGRLPDRPVWGGGGGGRRREPGRGGGYSGGGGGGGDYGQYHRREPAWEYQHHRSDVINRLAQPKADYSDARAEQRPRWERGGGGARQRSVRRPPSVGRAVQRAAPRSTGRARASGKFPPLGRVHGMSRLDALREQQAVAQEQLRELREQQRERSRQLAADQETEIEELHSMQGWQQTLQEKLCASFSFAYRCRLPS